MAELRYQRVLLKISGEALAGERGLGFDFDTMDRIAVITRVSSPLRSRMSCTASALITVPSIPM